MASKNPVKVAALTEIIEEYPHLRHAEIKTVDVPSEVQDQPKSLEETVQGAINRARNACVDCNYAFGIESGLMAVPCTKSGFMNVCICAIFDGENIYLGLSSAWEAPMLVTKYMIHEDLNMNDAAYRAGLTQNKNIRLAEGLVGIMTKGRLTRKEYTKEAIRTALIHIDQVAYA